VQLLRAQKAHGFPSGAKVRLDEVAAYQAELDHAPRFGLSPGERAGVLRSWQNNLADLPGAYQMAARRRDFDFDPIRRK
jgi:hypothetical protein